MCAELMAIAATALSAAQSLQAGNAQRAAARHQAATGERAAAMRMQEAERQRQALLRDRARMLGRLRLSPGSTLSGSRLDLLADAAAESGRDERDLLWQAQVGRDDLLAEAGARRAAGRAARQGGALGAARGLATAGSQVASWLRE